MRLTRSPVTTEPAAAEPTHVLHWVPGYLNSDGQGCWDLQDAAGYERGDGGAGCPRTYDTRDAGAAVLTGWVCAQLGYTVELEEARAWVWSVTPFQLRLNAGREPVWYVWPARAGQG
jgi:hypothetical protein